jgi:hypothetical protein
LIEICNHLVYFHRGHKKNKKNNIPTIPKKEESSIPKDTNKRPLEQSTKRNSKECLICGKLHSGLCGFYKNHPDKNAEKKLG